jgi:gamma-glutamyltranspeptidase/glutathione hydrolase
LPTRNHPSTPFQRASRRALARAFAAGALGLALAACAQGRPGEFAPVEGFAGVAAGDEPRAVVIGREILGNGGTAVDAAVAMYFAMAVTMPSRVSMGGGGVCVAFDGRRKRGEAIEFMPRAAPSGGMVPSGMRAMAALHARHGAMRWEQLLSPAETLARFGHAVSRSFARDLAAAADHIAASPDLSRLFAARSGRLAQTGDRNVQAELSAVLSGIRQQGAAYLHSGPFTRRLAEASSAVGMPLTAEDVRKNVPHIREAVAVPAGSYVAYFAPPRATGGVVAAQMWAMLSDVRSFDGAGEDERPHLFAEAALRAFAQRAAWMMPDGSSRDPVTDLVDGDRLERAMADYDPGQRTPASRYDPAPDDVSDLAFSAGFAVGDQFSNAVACNFTMNRLFGAGRVAEGTGILLAAPPRSPNDGSTSLAAVVVGNTSTGDVRFAGAAGGGPVGATALVRVMLGTVAAEQPLEAAVAAPRLHHGGAPDRVEVEPRLGEAARQALARRGHSLREAVALGHVNAFYCPGGLQDSGETCEVAADPRAYGLAVTAQ